MRNLRTLKDASILTGSDIPVTASTWDVQNDAILFTLGPSKGSAEIELRRSHPTNGNTRETSVLIAAWEALCPLPDLEFDNVLDLHYFPDTGISCLVLAGGDVINVRDDPLPEEPKIEIVGSVDGGIAAAAWSPDEEILAIATRQDTFLLMTIEFDNIASVPLSSEDAKLSKHVSVGWGKSETQFKGKRAKALRDPTMPERVEHGVLSPFDSKEVSISWRGDGAFVAINAIIDQGPRRMIRIFNRQGILESVTEPVDGLEGALSWRPAGNLIAGVQRLDNEAKVIFFERNGLRHGQFPLGLSSSSDSNLWTSPITLAWNVLSSVLAVSYSSHIQLWTMSNYHYYLKQQLGCEALQQKSNALAVLWHPEDSLRLSVSAAHGSPTLDVDSSADALDLVPTTSFIRDIQLISNVSRGPNTPPHDRGLVTVIDGAKLKITPLQMANVPPPMSLYELEVSITKDVSVDSTNSSLAALHEDAITIVSFNSDSHEPKVTDLMPLPKSSTQQALQICSFDRDIFVLLQDWTTGSVQLHQIFSSSTYSISSNQPPPLYHLVASVNHEGLYLLEANNLFRCRSSSSTSVEISDTTGFEKEHICLLPTNAPISHIEVLHHKDEVIAFASTSNGALYANHRQLLKNCTSFLVTASHIIVTTTNHLLKFIHVASVEDLEISPDEPETDERCRSIERGARLVTVMPTMFSLVLQMPRGNLETIFPRALVLASVRSNLEAKEYRKAFLICRTQRVDMNILHDYAPNQFVQNVQRFVDQLKKVEYIDLFLSQLRNEDVSKIMYKETVPQREVQVNGTDVHPNTKATVAAEPRNSISKVNRICDAFLSVLRDKYATNLQNVITANVCKIPPNIEAGLQVAAELREKQTDLAEAAVEHICFLVDVNRVYESALGLYDLDLALLVAQQSQKDPREYLPYLQNLQSMPLLRKKYAIDNDLKNYSKSLRYLFEMDDFEEFKTYMQKHELYKEALQLYQYDAGAVRSLTHLHAQFLDETHNYRDAGIAYESLNEFSLASMAYRAINMWEECLATAALVPTEDGELKSLAKSLADQLYSTKAFESSARIHLDYLGDVETSLAHYCKAHKFSTAIRIASMQNRPTLLSDIIDPGLVEASGTLTELLADCKAQLNAQVPRIRELRMSKAANPLAFFSGEGVAAGNADIPDDVSVTPSATSTAGGASLFTRYTQRSGLTNTVATGTSRQTSKNRRREERKRARGKKGSVYEEEYLVSSVGRLIERVNDTAGDVKSTLEGLLRRNMRERARVLEESMVEVVATCESCVAEVYEVAQSSDLLHKQTQASGAAEDARPAGAEGVVWDSLEQAKAARIVPVVKPYDRTLLAS